MGSPQRLKGKGRLLLLKDNETQFEVSYFLSMFQEVNQADPKTVAPPDPIAGFISDLSENTLRELQDQDLILRLEDGRQLPCQVESYGRLIIRGTLSGPSLPPSAGQLSP